MMLFPFEITNLCRVSAVTSHSQTRPQQTGSRPRLFPTLFPAETNTNTYWQAVTASGFLK